LLLISIAAGLLNQYVLFREDPLKYYGCTAYVRINGYLMKVPYTKGTDFFATPEGGWIENLKEICSSSRERPLEVDHFDHMTTAIKGYEKEFNIPSSQTSQLLVQKVSINYKCSKRSNSYDKGDLVDNCGNSLLNQRAVYYPGLQVSYGFIPGVSILRNEIKFPQDKISKFYLATKELIDSMIIERPDYAIQYMPTHNGEVQ
jgi:hypothetical protein